jgi:hypothetical protein
MLSSINMQIFRYNKYLCKAQVVGSYVAHLWLVLLTQSAPRQWFLTIWNPSNLKKIKVHRPINTPTVRTHFTHISTHFYSPTQCRTGLPICNLSLTFLIVLQSRPLLRWVCRFVSAPLSLWYFTIKAHVHSFNPHEIIEKDLNFTEASTKEEEDMVKHNDEYNLFVGV